MNATVQSVCVSLQVSTECPTGSRGRKHSRRDHNHNYNAARWFYCTLCRLSQIH